MRTLDEQGLQSLIKEVQSGVIKRHIYSNVTASGSDAAKGSLIFLVLTTTSAFDPWVIRYRVQSVIDSNNNTNQMADVIVGGINNKISYYSSSNIVFDSSELSAHNHIILTNKQNKIYFGINLKDAYAENHNITIEVQYFKNGQVGIFKDIKDLKSLFSDEEIYQFVLKEIDFSKEGKVSSGDVNIPENLSKVATTGMYNDLLERPKLLNVDFDQESDTLSFSYNENS